MFRIVFALLAVLYFQSGAFAFELLPTVRQALEEKGHHDLIEKFESIEVLSPEDFVKKVMSETELKPVGAGFNGITFKDPQGRIVKLSFGIYGALEMVELMDEVRQISPEQMGVAADQWKDLKNLDAIKNTDVDQLRGRTGPVGSQPPYEEIFGTLLWAAFSPRPVDLPDVITTDGLAFRAKFHDGPTLLKILESEREGTELYKRYDMNAIWAEVIRYQKANEEMLRTLGVQVDMFTPGNMIVIGEGSDIIIESIDNAVAKPSEQAWFYLELKGHRLPLAQFEKDFRLIVWPTISEHIVANDLWSLSYDQAITYLKAYHGFKSRYSAVKRLSQIVQWEIVEAPFLGNYKNIRQAQKELGVGRFRAVYYAKRVLSVCTRLLIGKK